VIRQKEGTFNGVHSYDPIMIPYEGQIIQIDNNTNWDLLIQIMLMDGNEVTYENAGLEKLRNYPKIGLSDCRFTMDEPIDIARRYESSLGLKFRRIFKSSTSNYDKVKNRMNVSGSTVG